MRTLSNQYRLWVLCIVGIIIYSIKIPFTQSVALFPFIYFFFYLRERSEIESFVSVQIVSKICWFVIFVWGLFLSLLYGFTIDNFKTLMWCLSFITMPVVISYHSRDFEHYNFFRFAILLACFPIGLLGVYEALTGHFLHETHESYLYFKNDYGFYRPNTIFFNVNDNAVFCLVCVIWTFFIDGEKSLKKWLRLFSIVIFGLNIFMVDSRGAELGFVIFLAVYYYRNVTGTIKTYAFISAIVAIIFGLLYFDYESFFELGSRQYIWEMSLQSLKETCFMGVGPGMIASINKVNFQNADIFAVHNLFLELFCDFGIVGLVALLVWYVNLFWAAISIKDFEPERSALLVSALIASLLASITCSSLVGKSFPVLFFAIVTVEFEYLQTYKLSSDYVE